MSYDLRHELGALAAQERAAADALPVEALRARAHRRRVARTAAASGLAVAAVAAVAVAAVALPGRLSTPPAESPAPSLTTPAPTPTAEAWPTAVTLDGPAPGCGDPMPALVRPDGDPEIQLEDVLAWSYAVPGSEQELAVTVTGPAGFELVAAEPVLLIVSDGVVLATNRGPEADSGIAHSTDDGSLTWPSLSLELVRCGTTGPGAAALEAGEYGLFVVVALVPPLDSSLPDLLVAGGPYPVELAPDPHPALEDLVISTSGLGPLTVGLPPATNPGAAMIELHPDYCADTWADSWGEGWAEQGLDADRWLPADYPNGTGPFSGSGLPFGVRVWDGVVQRIDVLSTLPRTAEGIGVGSTLAELQTAYPGIAEETAREDWSRVWVVRDAAGTLVFETADDLDGYLPELTGETVVGIRVFAPGAPDAATPTLGSDNVAGGCL